MEFSITANRGLVPSGAEVKNEHKLGPPEENGPHKKDGQHWTSETRKNGGKGSPPGQALTRAWSRGAGKGQGGWIRRTSIR